MSVNNVNVSLATADNNPRLERLLVLIGTCLLLAGILYIFPYREMFPEAQVPILQIYSTNSPSEGQVKELFTNPVEAILSNRKDVTSFTSATDPDDGNVMVEFVDIDAAHIAASQLKKIFSDRHIPARVNDLATSRVQAERLTAYVSPDSLSPSAVSRIRQKLSELSTVAAVISINHERAPAEARVTTIFKGERTLALEIYRRPMTDAYACRSDVEKAVQGLRSEIPGVKIEVRASILSKLTRRLILFSAGGCLALLVIGLLWGWFAQQMHAALEMTVAALLSFLMTLGTLRLLGVSINSVSILGLVWAAGFILASSAVRFSPAFTPNRVWMLLPCALAGMISLLPLATVEGVIGQFLFHLFIGPAVGIGISTLLLWVLPGAPDVALNTKATEICHRLLLCLRRRFIFKILALLLPQLVLWYGIFFMVSGVGHFRFFNESAKSYDVLWDCREQPAATKQLQAVQTVLTKRTDVEEMTTVEGSAQTPFFTNRRFDPLLSVSSISLIPHADGQEVEEILKNAARHSACTVRWTPNGPIGHNRFESIWISEGTEPDRQALLHHLESGVTSKFPEARLFWEPQTLTRKNGRDGIAVTLEHPLNELESDELDRIIEQTNAANPDAHVVRDSDDRSSRPNLKRLSIAVLSAFLVVVLIHIGVSVVWSSFVPVLSLLLPIYLYAGAFCFGSTIFMTSFMGVPFLSMMGLVLVLTSVGMLKHKKNKDESGTNSRQAAGLVWAMAPLFAGALGFIGAVLLDPMLWPMGVGLIAGTLLLFHISCILIPVMLLKISCPSEQAPVD
ncbi:MAG: efflux RND transporter permease subunit [Deltaproteobacteria bacterium]|nr:efflux RND transporter permease subunit [Deltaproteobacteria bacterium]